MQLSPCNSHRATLTAQLSPCDSHDSRHDSGAPDVDETRVTNGGVPWAINALDYPSPKLLAEEMLRINASDAEYGRYLRWRTEDAVVAESFRSLVS